MEPFIGQIQAFGFQFAPRGWAFCDGQLLPIQQHESLYSLLGTIYGGNGRTTFGLPDLRGRVSLHQGSGPGLNPRKIGEKGGGETHTLQVREIPSHMHIVSPGATTLDATESSPSGNYPALTAANSYASGSNASMGNTNSALTGGGGAHNNMQPYLVINWCIALVGVYPSRS